MLEQIAGILKNYKRDDNLQVLETTTFAELNLDSLDVVQLVMDIEDEFGVAIEMNSSITDVASLIKVIEAAKEV